MGFASFIEDIERRHQESAAYGEATIQGPAGGSARPLSPTFSPTTQVSAALISFLSQLRAINMELGRDILERLRNQNWRPIADRMDHLRCRLERFNLQVLWKSKDEKLRYANELEKEREFLGQAKKMMLDNLGRSFSQVKYLITEIRSRQAKEGYPPLHPHDIELCDRAEWHCEEWTALWDEAEGWIKIMEQKALEMQDSVFEDMADSIVRVVDKDQPRKSRT